MLIKLKDIEYHPTHKQLAEEFCELYEDDQAKFFNYIAEIFENKNNSLPMQLEYVSQSPFLTNKARAAMMLIGDYSYHNFQLTKEQQ